MKLLCRWLFFFMLAAGVLLGGSPLAAAQDSWAVYVYMCGSDLETEYGAATKNLNDLKTVQLPDNVRFFIQTGGAKKWHSQGVPSKALGRYVYDQQGFREIAKLEDASMGSGKTFQEFLSFAKEHFPADHRLLVLWNHGGGSLGGVCVDEKFNEEISLPQLRQALEAVEKANPDKPLFDLVAFDACLMATLETANTLQGYTRYMVASEELMPGTGTDYAGWAGALAKNPAMNGRDLGKVFCDTYIPYCEANQCEDTATLSLLDMSRLPALNAAYEAWGREMVREAKANPRIFYTAYDRRANRVERYGFNAGDIWTNMIDLGALAAELPDSAKANAFTKAVQEAVICRTVGPYRQHGTGLSGYYCLDGRVMTLAKYTPLPGASPAFADFYRSMLAGSGDGKTWYYFDSEKIANAPVVIGQDNVATVTLTPDDANAISEAFFRLGFFDSKGRFLFLGSDDRLMVDWEKGIFRDDYDCTWPTLNGHFIPLEIDEQQSDYILYHSYILLNGKKCYLKVAYNKGKKAFEILGAQRLLEEEWLDREILQLHPGDKITPLFLTDEGKKVNGESFVLEKEPSLTDELLPDGRYAFAFEFLAPHNDVVDSDFAYFVIENGQLTEVSNR